VQEKPHPSELRTPKKDKVVSKRQSIHGVVMGAGERSYVIRDNEIDVMKNVMGGVEDTGVLLQEEHLCCSCTGGERFSVPAVCQNWGSKMIPQRKSEKSSLAPEQSGPYKAETLWASELVGALAGHLP
jgi:hypothetical protein